MSSYGQLDQQEKVLTNLYNFFLSKNSNINFTIYHIQMPAILEKLFWKFYSYVVVEKYIRTLREREYENLSKNILFSHWHL